MPHDGSVPYTSFCQGNTHGHRVNVVEEESNYSNKITLALDPLKVFPSDDGKKSSFEDLYKCDYIRHVFPIPILALRCCPIRTC